MATRMTIFIGLTVYLLLTTIMLGLIASSLIDYNGVVSKSNVITSDDIDTASNTGLRQNALIIWNLITLSYETVGLGSVILYFLFITIPTIIWALLLASFLIPTTNAGG